MKKALISILFLFAFMSSAHALTVYLDASQLQDGGDNIADTLYSLQPGENFWVNIYADALPPVYAMGFDLTYDSTQLDVLTLGAADIWPGFPTEIDNGSDLIQFGGGAPIGFLNSGDMVLLAYIQFECLLPGTSDLILGTPSAAGRGFINSSFAKITDIDYVDMTVSQVPIPSAIFMLGGGLVALVAIRRRRT